MFRIRFVSLICLCAASALVASACSDDDKSPAEQFAAEYCQLLSPCCAEAGFSSDPSGCEQIMGFALMGSSFDEGSGDACLSAMRAERSNEEYCTMVHGLEPCESVFASPSGSVQPGGTCESDSDCANTAEGQGHCFNASDDGSGGDLCMIATMGAEGSTPCVGNKSGGLTVFFPPAPPPKVGYVCDQNQGLSCDFTTSRCAAMKKVGEPCSYETPCVDGAYCVHDTDLCAPRGEIGADCEGFDLDECVEEAYCDDSQKCAKRLPAGSACTVGECEGNCVDHKCEPAFDFGYAFLCGGD
jgi:hypothetical protein